MLLEKSSSKEMPICMSAEKNFICEEKFVFVMLSIIIDFLLNYFIFTKNFCSKFFHYMCQFYILSILYLN
jgi:hypothetical protein